MASERVVNFETVTKAVDSLLKWRKSQSETQKPKLFDQDEEFIYLILTMKKIPPKGRVNPHKIPIPHSLLSPFSETCLIIDDRAKAQLTKAQAQKKIQSESIPISKILKLSKLASDYRPFEAKRKLCNSYDLFFADKAVIPLLSRLLGKQFYKQRKIPVQVDLKKKNWKEQIEKACASAMLFMRTGTCSVVKVAKLSMERDGIVENLISAIHGVVEVVPKNWANVRSFHVKLLESVALPVYQAVPDLKLKIEGGNAAPEKKKEKIKKKKKKVEEEEEEEGEMSDRKVGKKKGRIHEVKYMDDEKVEDENDDDNDGNEDGDDVLVGDDSENDEREFEGLVDKKRKKKGDVSELRSVKTLKESAKRKKKEGLIKKSEDKLSAEDDEGLGKKKKEKKGLDGKVKVKKSKKAA